MTETFTKKDNSKKSVVLVEYPKKGSWAVGFATKDNKTEMSSKTNENLVNVFIPTTPNPTSGYLIMIRKEKTIDAKLTVDEGLSIVVSAGMIGPSKLNL